jgi:hypothetical protein
MVSIRHRKHHFIFRVITPTKAGEIFIGLMVQAALDAIPRLPQNLQYQGEALFTIAHTRDSLLSIWCGLQARESRSEEP